MISKGHTNIEHNIDEEKKNEEKEKIRKKNWIIPKGFFGGSKKNKIKIKSK
jgi:hypothetical protein